MSILQLPSGRSRLQIRRKALRVDELYDTEEAAIKGSEVYHSKGVHGQRGLTLDGAWEKYHASPRF